MATLEELYKFYEILTDAKETAAAHEAEFLKIVQAVKGGAQEKRLASQLIARFFKYFPQHTDKAMNAQLDLCEDEDVAIRKQAIRDLPSICKESPENLPRIADVLTQLLQTDDTTEHNLVQSSLLTIMRQDMKGALQGIFSQIINGEDTIREKAIKFLSIKLKLMGEELVTSKIEEYVVEEVKKVLQDVTADEFLNFMEILSGLKCMKTLQGRQQLVSIISEQADLDQPFQASSADCVDRVVQCTSQAIPLFSKNVHSTKFVGYYCDQVLPVLPALENSSGGDDTRLELLKQLADMSQWCPDLGMLPERLTNVFDCLKAFMPLPPDASNAENAENGTAPPALQFSYVECLMFTLHQLARRQPDFLSGSSEALGIERMKDYKLRLQYFALGVQVYLKQLRTALQGKAGEALKTDENKVKVAALKTTNNINMLIKDFMHIPPIYKAIVKLSWKAAQAEITETVNPAATPAGSKRIAPTNAIVSLKVAKTSTPHMDRAVYAPPTGKYSEKAGQAPGDGAPIGSGRGAFRGNRRGGRGSWRGRY